MKRIVLSAVLVLIAVTLMPAAATARPAEHGHAGVWRAIQCAQWESDGPLDLQCETWGDGSELQMMIAPGDHPRITFIDRYSSYCEVDLNAPTTQRIARGVGTYDEDGMLWFDVLSGGCGSAKIGPYTESAFYWDPGSDTLWSHDPDGTGYGLHWWRVGR